LSSLAVFAAQDDNGYLQREYRIVAMPCSHLGPPEVFQKAEEWLRDRGIPEPRWSGIRIAHAENTPGGEWASVVIEIERRGAEWWVTNIDRRNQPVPEDQLGLRTK
jgi:hypothetical protein